MVQPAAVQINDIRDAMGRLELAAGMSGSDTVVSTCSGRAVRNILKQHSTPSPEALWAGGHIM